MTAPRAPPKRGARSRPPPARRRSRPRRRRPRTRWRRSPAASSSAATPSWGRCAASSRTRLAARAACCCSRGTLGSARPGPPSNWQRTRGFAAPASTGAAATRPRAQPPYWPWSEALRTYVRDADPVGLRWELGSRAADVAQIVPELAERLGDLGEPPDMDGRAGAVPPLRLVRGVPRRRLQRPPAGARPRRPALGGRALAAPAALRRPSARRLRPAADRHLPRRRARPPPPARRHARRPRRRGRRPAGDAQGPRRRAGSPTTSSSPPGSIGRRPTSPRRSATRPAATRSSSARSCA